MLTRVLTGLVLAPGVVLLVLYAPLIAVAGVVLLAGVFSLDEYARITLPDNRRADRILLVAAGTAVMLVAHFRPELLAEALAGAALAGMALHVLTPLPTETAARRSTAHLGGTAYVALLFAFLLMMLGRPGDGRQALLLSFLVVWPGDSAAYFAGRFFGRHKLHPRVSPKKTVEGAFGGVAGSVLGAFLARWWLLPGLSPLDCVLLGAGGAVLEQVGDLAESLLKRSAGVKDSGALLPGHGGMLDRVDGLLFAAPFVYCYLKYLS